MRTVINVNFNDASPKEEKLVPISEEEIKGFFHGDLFDEHKDPNGPPRGTPEEQRFAETGSGLKITHPKE